MTLVELATVAELVPRPVFNGLAGGPVIVLTSTNLALPASAWTPIVTNNFDGSGNYTETITANPASAQQFYMLKAQ